MVISYFRPQSHLTLVLNAVIRARRVVMIFTAIRYHLHVYLYCALLNIIQLWSYILPFHMVTGSLVCVCEINNSMTFRVYLVSSEKL